MITERSRLESRKWRAELAEQERIEQEKRDAPRKAAEAKVAEFEAQLQENHRKLRQLEAEKIQKQRDEALDLGELSGATMTKAEADANNEREANLFVAQCPEYAPYKTDENRDKILKYLVDVNGVHIWSVKILKDAFCRLRDLGLLTEKPAPVPAARPVHDTEVIPETPKEPETFQGWDPNTDEPITLTKRQVNLLSSEEYKAIFRLRKSDLALPMIGPGAGRRW
jgi:hypothetical protein